MSKKAHIAHQIPGRIRIKIHAARGNPALLEQAKHLFTGIPGLQNVVVRPDSGSILLHYDERLAAEFEAQLTQRWAESQPKAQEAPPEPHERIGDEFDAMTRQIEAEAAFLAGRSHTAHVIVEFFKDFDRQVKLATNNTIDLKIVLALGLAVITFIGVGAEAATPMWITLALFALNHFIEMQPAHAVAQPGSGLGTAPAQA